ncbi:hypothetical protein PR003_g10603 [Phytophthora rubi]|uniref:Uncharacterized protein n=1 Tax=Phytophthora rubi TaxID=129364 RepID=A0A6A3MZW8_9STRA|nr:hypothetical protein PR002_g10200 [Phytophthora rubi]KAE9033528.1 hypothetical protein PR001_g10125 [Phytophthora rubi]KAE9340238.1 hypothetical protein PR003_g10603 [Phytophthora rubi]
MFEHFLTPLPLPPINAEKVYTMHHTVRKYVPSAFQYDLMYSVPTKKQGDAAKTAKQTRREHRAAMAVAAKKHQDQRGRKEDGEATHSGNKKRKTSDKK